MRVVLALNKQFVGVNGGMEKVFCNLSNELVHRGHEVTSVYCTERTGEIYTPLDPRVKLENLAHRLPGGGWESVRPLPFVLKREWLRIVNRPRCHDYVIRTEAARLCDAARELLSVARPDVIISFDARTSLLYETVSSAPVVTMCHGNADFIWKESTPVEKEALRKSDVFQVLMPSDKVYFEKRLPGLPIVQIPNIVPQYEEIDMEKDHKEALITDVARISEEKRQHLLIEAFAMVAGDYPSWKIELYGSEQGRPEYTEKLKKLVQSHHLEERVLFNGDTRDVLSVYRRASIFGFPSSYEGFPLAMTEAMSAGLPVVAYETCPAVNELVVDSRNGFLVKDGDLPFAEALRKLMDDEKLREKLGRQGREDMKAYAEKKIYDQWEDLLEKVVRGEKIETDK